MPSALWPLICYRCGTGAQLGASIFSNSITYAIGYFNGSSDGSNGNFQWAKANELAGRLFFRPFANTSAGAINQFGIGLGGSSANQHGPIAGLKTVGQTTFCKYSSTALANGQQPYLTPGFITTPVQSGCWASTWFPFRMC